MILKDLGFAKNSSFEGTEEPISFYIKDNKKQWPSLSWASHFLNLTSTVYLA